MGIFDKKEAVVEESFDDAETPAEKPKASKGKNAQPAEKPPEISAPSPAPKKTNRWLVKRDKVISWYGSMTTMAKDSVVDEHSYGEHGMKRIRDAGVELELIEE